MITYRSLFLPIIARGSIQKFDLFSIMKSFSRVEAIGIKLRLCLEVEEIVFQFLLLRIILHIYEVNEPANYYYLAKFVGAVVPNN